MVINYLDILTDLMSKDVEKGLSVAEKKRLNKLLEWFDLDMESIEEVSIE